MTIECVFVILTMLLRIKVTWKVFTCVPCHVMYLETELLTSRKGVRSGILR